MSKFLDLSGLSHFWDKIKDKLSTVAFTGSYADLTDKPTIPSVDSALSSSSTNPVQNKAIHSVLSTKITSAQALEAVSGAGYATSANVSTIITSGGYVTSTYVAGATVASAGNATTVNGKTVSANVPAAAEFTDSKVKAVKDNDTAVYLAGTVTNGASAHGTLTYHSDVFISSGGELYAPTMRATTFSGTATNASNANNASNLGGVAASSYALDASVVHTTGDENISGSKAFYSQITANKGLLVQSGITASAGNVSVERVATTAEVKVANGYSDSRNHTVALRANQYGNAGVWDDTTSKWLIYNDSAGNTIIPAETTFSSGTLIKNGATVSGGMTVSGVLTTNNINASGNWISANAFRALTSYGLHRDVSDDKLTVYAAPNSSEGAILTLFGKDHTSAGKFVLGAVGNSSSCALHGMADGTLSWGGTIVASTFSGTATDASALGGKASSEYVDTSSVQTIDSLKIVNGLRNTGGAFTLINQNIVKGTTPSADQNKYLYFFDKIDDTTATSLGTSHIMAAVRHIYGRTGNNSLQLIVYAPISGSSTNKVVSLRATASGTYEFIPGTTNEINLGGVSNKWATAYATTFSGALVGNADTATDASSLGGIAASGYVTTDVTSATPTYASGFADYNAASTVKIYRNGHICMITGAAKPTEAVGAASATLFTLPEGYRPIAGYTCIQQGSGQNRFFMTVGSGGSVKVERYGVSSAINIGSGAWLNVACTYLCA